ncbi:MAG TPA: zf-HC2 domain-containing protein [Longimicrobiales bacterium]|nr:zf-HC2 domain-containing protein [Longimicrobiales bacterium]
MSHYPEGVLQAYLDDEVGADARAQVDAHVSACADCSARLQDLRQLDALFTSAVQTVDVRTIPAAALAELQVRAQQRGWRERFAGSPRALARAAMFVIGISAVAAATVPGSPLRGWLIDTWEAITSDQETVAPPAQPQPEPEVAATAARATASNGRIRVLLRAPDPSSRVHVVLIDGERAVVEATGAAVAPRTRTGSGWVELVGGAGDIRISLPRGVPRATVEVDGRLYLSKEGADLRVFSPTVDTAGAELIFRPGR